MLGDRSRREVLFRGGWAVRMAVVCIAVLVVAPAIGAEAREETKEAKKMTVGAYYFDGWAGRSPLANDAKEPWARTAPDTLTRRMIEEFPEREPIWGWRDDSPKIMERQIDLAADHGLAFFAFCWYWRDDGRAINKQRIKDDPLHTGLKLYLKAKNNHRLKFCLLVANHQGAEIRGTENWKQAAEFWMPYLKHPQYVTVGGKPLVIVFNPKGGDRDGFARLQEAARKAGLPGVAIAGCAGGALEMGYTHRTHYNVIPGYAAGSEQHKYAELVAANRAAWGGSREQPYIPIVTAGWDKRPWEGPTGLKQGDRSRLVLPGPHAGAVRGFPARCEHVDGRAPRADHRRAHRSHLRLERVRRRWVYRTDEGRPGRQVPESGQVCGDAGQPVAPADADKPCR